jgi:ribonuclease HII
MSPNLNYEKKLWAKGCKLVAGLDEAGRGSWAGPLVAGAVILPSKFKIKGIKDSKLLSPEKRKELFLAITKNCVSWGVGIVTQEEIDKWGIGPANRLVFERAVKNLSQVPQFLLVDGVKIFSANIPAEFVVKGDQKIMSIAAASIVAKVIRDKILEDLHNDYPEYNFAKHKGYGTEEHLRLINQYGICEIHRMSYRPIYESSNLQSPISK